MNAIDRFYTSDAATYSQAYLAHVAKTLSRIDAGEVATFIRSLLQARECDQTVFFIGNGGSAATASHFANDLAIGTQSRPKPFRVVSLTDNVAVLTAIANDFGYDQIFSRQLEAVGKAGDVLVAISASGNSPNLIRAFECAKAMGVKTIALTAFDGGRLRALADEGVHVPTEPKEYGPAEDAHMVLDHLVSSYLMRFVS